jgi:hypothetical protein
MVHWCRTHQISRLLHIAFLLLSLCMSGPSNVGASQPSSPARILVITLIPNFEDQSIQFDGQTVQFSATGSPDFSGYPLDVEQDWKDPYNSLWHIRGTIQGGRVEFNPDENAYHLLIGRLNLGPQDDIKFILPFVNLDYAEIQPAPDPPDKNDLESRQRTHRFTYRGGESGREIESLDIRFSTISKEIDLTLIPLAGETFVPDKNGFRLSGKVLFHSITDFDEFTSHCQSTANRILHGDDYRSAHLLYALDYPHHFGPDVLSPVYGSKPTLIGLRTKLVSCQYDQQQEQGEVEALFSGRTRAIDPDPALFPEEWRDLDTPEGNDSFIPPERFRGVKGYVITLGRIVLAPGDTLIITVPDAIIQVDSLTPVPDNLVHLDTAEAGQQTQIVYKGPAAFKLSLPYVTQSSFYVKQFPALIRPGITLLEEEFGESILFSGTWLTWIVLGVGLFLLVVSRIMVRAKWLAILGWLLMAVSVFYGVRGSFGLLFLAIALYLSQVAWHSSALKNRAEFARKTLMALIGFGLIVLAVRIDSDGNTFFQGLSEPDLSPFTPLVLMVLTGTLFLVLYGRPQDAKLFTSSDLPTLALFLAVLALYDTFDKSLLALLILFLGVLYVSVRAIRSAAGGNKREVGIRFGTDLQSRLSLVFGNRIIPVAIILLIVFAIVNDLSSTYANEMQIRISPLLTPIAIPLLSFVSVSLAFTSIALLFVLVYPFLPSRSGYIKATLFAVFLFLVFLFGIGTDDRLIASLPNILLGRVLYYFSVPLLIGLYFDIHEFMQNENKRLAGEGKEQEHISFRAASGMYLKNLQTLFGTLTGILSLVLPSIYAFSASQPVLITYFDLLEKLVLLPI